MTRYENCGPVKLGPWQFTFELVTPSMAQSMLDTMNGNNRSINKAAVARYVEDTKLDRWLLTPSPIVICSDGNLGDGQHRLEKVIQTGEPQWFIIVREADPEIRTVLDNGKVRTAKDLFKIRGVKSEAASLALYSYFYEQKPYENWAARQPLNKFDHLAYAEANEKELVEALEIGKSAYRGYKLFSKSNYAFFYHQSRRQEVEEETVVSFLHMLTGSPQELDKHDPIACLRNFCDSECGMAHHKAVRDRMGRVYWVLVSTFNHWASGATKKLQLPKPKTGTDFFYPSPKFGYLK